MLVLMMVWLRNLCWICMVGWWFEVGDWVGWCDMCLVIFCIIVCGYGFVDLCVSFYFSVMLYREVNMLKICFLIFGLFFLVVCVVMVVLDDYVEVIVCVMLFSFVVKVVIVIGVCELIYNLVLICNVEIFNVVILFGGGQGVCVCVDSKDVLGCYIGVYSFGILLWDGKIVGGSFDYLICDRVDVYWQFFLELEVLLG